MARDHGNFLRRKGQARRSVKSFTDAIEEQLEGLKTATVEGMEQAVALVAVEAARLTPVDTTALLSSQYEEVVVVGDTIVGAVGYDKEGNVPYAVFQHEIPYDHSDKGNPRAEVRFLAKGFERQKDNAIAAIMGQFQWK